MRSAPQPPPGREVLIRNCYLNPRTFHQFRPYFTRSAFSVIDCPPLTTLGKTSSDIRMVMDILSTLQHRTQFDEFIILSGDADFTPVLFQLRANDYRTTVVAIGPAAEALAAVLEGFGKIPVEREQRPKVAVFGDLYSRDNRVMNQDLIRFIENHGGEVVTTPYSEYARMIANPYFRKNWRCTNWRKSDLD